MAYSGQHHAVRHRGAPLHLEDAAAIERLASDFNATFAETYGAGTVNPGGGIEVRLFKLSATYPFETARRAPVAATMPAASPKGSRDCCWSSPAPVATPVFDRSALPPGQEIHGPALIEDVDTVIAVDPGWRYRVGDDLSGTLRRTG